MNPRPLSILNIGCPHKETHRDTHLYYSANIGGHIILTVNLSNKLILTDVKHINS